MKLIRPLLALAVLSAIVLVPALPAMAAVTGGCNPPTIKPDWNDVPYKTLQDGTKVTTDIFVPPGQGPFPAVVTIHGSLWRSGCKENVEVEADRTRRNGFAVFNIDTRLACKKPQPGIDPGLCGYHAIDPAIDVGDAVAWVRAHAGQYKADPSLTFAVAYRRARLHATAERDEDMRGGSLSTQAPRCSEPRPLQRSCS